MFGVIRRQIMRFERHLFKAGLEFKVVPMDMGAVNTFLLVVRNNCHDGVGFLCDLQQVQR